MTFLIQRILLYFKLWSPFTDFPRVTHFCPFFLYFVLSLFETAYIHCSYEPAKFYPVFLCGSFDTLKAALKVDIIFFLDTITHIHTLSHQYVGNTMLLNNKTSAASIALSCHQWWIERVQS